MAAWYNKIVSNISLIPDMISYYEKELLDAQIEVKIKGNLETNLAKLPGQTETRYSQLEEIEAILNYLNIELRKLQQKYFKQYMESYNKALSSREAEKYASGESDVCDFEMIINEVALIRNKYLGILKSLESKNFMVGHIVRLRTAGMENVSVNDN
jgi:hypothetical protein